MEHDLFKAKNLEEGIHNTVGDCNGIPARERWEKETPVFAKQILSHLQTNPGTVILDYGCGVGRLSKEILFQDQNVTVIGLDASEHQLKIATEYVNDSRFIPILPHQLKQKVDLVYCVYCLQHVPAVELRDVLYRIYTFLKPGGIFIYCSSDYRMAIRYDGGGFFDDRFLGVNIREEISRLFTAQGDLFDRSTTLEPVVEKMVWGELPHTAKVYLKKNVGGHLFNARIDQVERSQDPALTIIPPKRNDRRLVLRNRLSPGDILVMTTAIRALHKAHGDKFMIDVDTPCPQIFENNPYLTKFDHDGADVQMIDMQYPEIHKSGASGRHFSDGHRKYLEEILEIKIPRVGLLPDIFLNQDEKLWPSPVLKKTGFEGKYWAINAGSKSDYPLKQYHRWQEVVDRWAIQYPNIRMVQIGQLDHNHKALDGVIDMRGKTDIRELFRTIYHAEGVLSCVSFPMHIAAALEKPCVVVAGGREGTRWELYPSHRFLYTNGITDCALYDGCWKSKTEECKNLVETVPLCMELIRPEDIVRAMELYYLGGVLKEVAHV
jgi:ADP-heptose:LPS heptosyltransferase/ubiquinone/menaquinone biosynthesis C-methylase UbiE